MFFSFTLGGLQLVATNGFFNILQHLAVVYSIIQQYYLIKKLHLKQIVWHFEDIFKGDFIGDNPWEFDENLSIIKRVKTIYVFFP